MQRSPTPLAEPRGRTDLDIPPSPPVAEEPAAALGPEGRPPAPGRPATPRRGARTPKAVAQRWLRLVHVYSSMAALLVVLFFGITGLTLNHPEWTLGFDTTTSTTTASLPDGAVADDGSVDLLVVSEHLRSDEGVRGEITDYATTADGAHLTYRGPGYAADVEVDAAAGTYELSTEQQGIVGILNDLHKGRDTDSSWG